MIRCPECGRWTAPLRYCGECGRPLPAASARDAGWAQADTGGVPVLEGDDWGQAETGAAPVIPSGPLPSPARHPGGSPEAGDAAPASDRRVREIDGGAEGGAGGDTGLGARLDTGIDPEHDADETHAWRGPHPGGEPLRLTDTTAPAAPRGRRVLLAASGLVAVAAVAGLVTSGLGHQGAPRPGVVANPNPTPTAPGTPAAAPTAAQARQAALAIDELLTRSAAQRTLVSRATTCSASADDAFRDLETVYSGRRDLLEKMHHADFASLPHGDELQDHLGQAWVMSTYADENFLEWATARRQSPAPCSVHHDAYEAGLIQSAAAHRHKARFAKLWETYVRAPLQLPVRRGAADI